MNFIRVKDTRTGVEYDWMADIQSISDLMELEEQFVSRNAWCIQDYMASKDYADQVNEIFKGNPINNKSCRNHSHPQNKLGQFLNAAVLSFPEKIKFYPLQFFTEKLSKANNMKLEQLLKHGRILINKNGGFFTWHKDMAILEEKKDNRFPQYSIKEVKVSKWFEGTHWYITINGTNVIVDGIEKWKSEKDAWDAAKKWTSVNDK